MCDALSLGFHLHGARERPFGLRAHCADCAMGKATAAKSKASAATSSAPTSAASSRHASPTPSPKSVVGTYSLDGVPVAWDNSPEIRDRIRAEYDIVLNWSKDQEKGVKEYVDGTKQNIILNYHVVKPLILLMKENDLSLPSVDRLIEAVDHFYKLLKLPRSGEFCYQQAWAVRRLCSKLKSCIYRPQPPQDSLLMPRHAISG